MEKSDKSKSSHESIDQLAMDIIHSKYQSIWNRLQVNNTRKWTSKTPQTLFPLQKRGLVPAVLATASVTSFNWFLHTMLFYHTKYVLHKQEMKKSEEDEEENLGLDEEAQDNEDN